MNDYLKKDISFGKKYLWVFPLLTGMVKGINIPPNVGKFPLCDTGS